MNELTHSISTSHTITQQDIDNNAGALMAQILPDEHIDPFNLHANSRVSPVVLSIPHGGWQYPQSLVNRDNLERLNLTDTNSDRTMLSGGDFLSLAALKCTHDLSRRCKY